MLIGRGLSALAAKAIVYGVVAALVGGALLGIRQHYVNKGWNKAIAAVKKQDDRAVAAASKVEEQTARCDSSNGFWDVITQDCRLQEEKQ
jgi:hypothetical protein